MTANNIPKPPAVLAAYLVARGSRHLSELEREQVKVIVAGRSVRTSVVAYLNSEDNPEVFFMQRCRLGRRAGHVHQQTAPPEST